MNLGELIYTKGATPKDRLNTVERKLRMIVRRLNAPCIVYNPPIPISSFQIPDSDGVFFRYMFPSKGAIGYCIVTSIKPMMINILHMTKDGNKSWEIEIPPAKINLNIVVSPGDRLVMTAYEASVHAVGVALPYIVDFNEMSMKEYLIGELEAIDAKAKKE